MIPQKEEVWKKKKIVIFSPLLWIGAAKVKTVFLSNCRLMSFKFLTIEIHKNTTETSRVTDKQYFSKSFYRPNWYF